MELNTMTVFVKSLFMCLFQYHITPVITGQVKMLNSEGN